MCPELSDGWGAIVASGISRRWPSNLKHDVVGIMVLALWHSALMMVFLVRYGLLIPQLQAMMGSDRFGMDTDIDGLGKERY